MKNNCMKYKCKAMMYGQKKKLQKDQDLYIKKLN